MLEYTLRYRHMPSIAANTALHFQPRQRSNTATAIHTIINEGGQLKPDLKVAFRLLKLDMFFFVKFFSILASISAIYYISRKYSMFLKKKQNYLRFFRMRRFNLQMQLF